MKLKKKQKSKNQIIAESFTPIEQFTSTAYLFMMLLVFPLYVKNQYQGIGDAKYQLFFVSTLMFLGISVFIHGIKKILEQKEENKVFTIKKENFSVLDLCVFSYGLLVLFSFIFSDYKDYALKGATGWEMGLISQMMFIGIYFFLSRQRVQPMYLLTFHLIGSFFTFLLGILHRFQIDPLGMYEGLNLTQMTEFLSTIGQATWYSSYICTVFPIGLVLFFVVKERKWRIPLFIYNGVSFGIVVTQNSDSAFIALAGILVLLALFSCKKREYWMIFWEIMMLMWGTFVGIGLLQRIFVNKAIPLDAISLFFSQSIFSMAMLAVSILCYLLSRKISESQMQTVLKITRLVIKAGMVSVVFLLPVIILFVYWNTTGRLMEWFGFQSSNNYLFFDMNWGNKRGVSWMLAWQEFVNMPILQKLFGVGPDAFSAHLYRLQENQEKLMALHGNLRLTNAHNEYLNSLICYGVLGLAAWIFILGKGITGCFRKAEENPVFLGFALCIIGYAGHNVFCYQQVCCTPFLFIVLAVGESLTKQVKSHTI